MPGNIPACSDERIAELRAAFNDPNYMPAYCLDGETSAGNQTSVDTQTPIPIVGIIAVGLVIMFLFKKG
jgi:hypothetical protein